MTISELLLNNDILILKQSLPVTFLMKPLRSPLGPAESCGCGHPPGQRAATCATLTPPRLARAKLISRSYLSVPRVQLNKYLTIISSKSDTAQNYTVPGILLHFNSRPGTPSPALPSDMI